MWFYEQRKQKKKIIMMRELFLGKIIDLILSVGFFCLYSEYKKILCWNKGQAQNVLEAKNG